MNLVLLHAGQSAQPKPDPVRRTAAPVTMIAQIATRAATVIARYCAALIRHSVILRRLRR